MRTLERSHPITCLCFLAAVLCMTFFSLSPVIIAVSLSGALLTAGLSGKLRGAWFVPIMTVLTTITNPLFSHNGVTVLFFIGDTAFTLEAVVYGAVFGAMLSAAALWGMLSVRFITSDKYVWLFGRILPSAGLTLCCALRFVPLLIRRTGDYIKTRRAQCTHCSDTHGDQGGRGLRVYLSAFSASLGYSAEEAISAADTMRARGYGSGKRTFCSRYRFGLRDGTSLAAALAPTAVCAAMSAAGAGRFFYYPAISALKLTAEDAVLYAAFGVLCLTPSAAIITENFKRRRGAYASERK